MAILRGNPHLPNSWHFCLSSHQEQVVKFGEWLYMDVLKEHKW